MKYEADKSEENISDADDAMGVPNNKRKAKEAVGKSGINYNFQHSRRSSENSEDAQVYSPRQLLEEESKKVHRIFRSGVNTCHIVKVIRP